MLEKKNVTVIFSDLEGSILEEDKSIPESFSNRKFTKLLEQFHEYEKITHSEIQLHILSPIERNSMLEVLELTDASVLDFNISHASEFNEEGITPILPVVQAVISQNYTEQNLKDEDFLREKRESGRILYLDEQLDYLSIGDTASGKGNYVSSLMRFKDADSRANYKYIYFGNGRNDIMGFRLVNAKGGYTICPANSRKKLQAIASYVSKETDCLGFVDGMAYINRCERQK